MNKKLYILAFSALMTFNACDDFLDTVPKGVVIPTTVDDYGNLMKDISLSTSYNALPYFCSDDVLVPDERINLTSPDHKAYFWMKDFYRADEPDYVWNNTYEHIYTTNVVISNIMGATEGTEQDRYRVLSEAKISRAFYLWYMSSLYGPSAIGVDDDALSIPMPLEPNLEAKLRRSTAQAVNQQILDDMTDLEKYLPEMGSNNYKPTKASAHALKARILFYMGKYDEAAQQADKALAYNNALDDMREWTFATAYPSGKITNREENISSPEKLWYHSCNGSNALRMTAISKSLQALYLENPKDLRYKFWFSAVDHNGKPFYPDNTPCYIQTTPNHSLTVPEMMLIKAEALARHNDAAALDILNQLRTCRFAEEDYKALTADDGKDLLQMVLDERRRELVLCNLRWLDMKRLDAEGRITETLERTTPQGEVHQLKPKSNLYLFPIPLMVMQLNGNITPNER